MNVLGVSALYHDAAAALVVDGEVVAAAQEERFTRVKNDASLPEHAMEFCLDAGGVPPDGIDVVAYYEKPLTSFVRVLKTYTAIGPKGLRTFPRAMGEASRNKLWVAYEIERALRDLGYRRPGETVFAEHHTSHAAAAFYPSPFESACVLTFDGVGEWATSSIGVGRGRRIDLLAEMRFPHSIGLLYSAFTYSAGLKVNSGEYKLMGLAPFGTPRYRDRILDRVVDLRDDGSFTLDLSYFDFLAGRRMTNQRFDLLFDGPPRHPDRPITRRECDLARSIQDVIEEIVLRMAHHGHELTGERQAVLGGGVALNCVANGRLLREGPFDDIWVQPAAGDAGSALGCALWAWHEVRQQERPDRSGKDAMRGSLLGPEPCAGDVTELLEAEGRPFECLDDPAVRAAKVAELLASGAVVGVCSGPMEFGPRALGNRSILADARDGTMQRRLNVKIKNRESFPTVRASGPRGACVRLVRARPPVAVHVHRGACAGRGLGTRRRARPRGGRGPTPSGRGRRSRRPTGRRPLAGPGGHPREWFRADPDRGSRAVPRAGAHLACLPRADRLPGAGEHLVQRAW